MGNPPGLSRGWLGCVAACRGEQPPRSASAATGWMGSRSSQPQMDTARHSRNQRREFNHGLHPPSPRLRRASKISQIEKRRTKRKMNLNSRTHEQINQPVSRQDAKAQRGRERRGNLAGKQETAGKQEETRFNHRGPPRGTEGERKRGRGEGDNIQYSTRNLQCSRCWRKWLMAMA